MTALIRFAPHIAIAMLLAATAWWLYDAGVDAERGRLTEKTIETHRNITDADARGPRTPDDVDRRLRDGSF
jgi:hypothetical protein